MPKESKAQTAKERAAQLPVISATCPRGHNVQRMRVSFVGFYESPAITEGYNIRGADRTARMALLKLFCPACAAEFGSGYWEIRVEGGNREITRWRKEEE